MTKKQVPGLHKEAGKKSDNRDCTGNQHRKVGGVFSLSFQLLEGQVHNLLLVG